MRDFSEFEKDIIKRIVSDSNKGQIASSVNIIIDEMEKVNIAAIEWDNTYTFVKFYGVENDKSYAKVLDIIFLLKYLEESRYIYSHLKKGTNSNFICASKFVKHGDYYITKNILSSDGVHVNEYLMIHTDIGKEIEERSKKLIHPSYLLIDLVLKDFKTPEQRKFEIQLNEAKKQTNYSRGALYASLAALVLSLVSTLFTTCTDTKIENKQLNQIIQSIEKQAIPKK
ncbi:hypothetical protein Palpr_0618 [Paludibacter propionicigenes WB4]|uniref:Uncharacterized protein n=1 Tax=Paludibacter propionicigenes (strain DSM 17365 / JCM 13257 / WB4) TaxID=694427 RepID=E4T230_PALPW|nr:hypothetical protein [Paludibacter propionicigenes]ADQ78774.1 hypothetical protein Palpr_0618 [Paludibacter propionicigenes WB4]